MGEITESINKKTSIILSRNKPVALVVGAASFFGSFIVDKLLDKDIQVIGIDDLVAGEKQNLTNAVQNNNFHFIIESPDRVDLDIPRLDYIFVLPGKRTLSKVLDFFKKHKARCLLISSIDLYEKGENKEDLKDLQNLESKLARFASDYHLNARILRLGPVFGPRMDFKIKDPLVKLIQQSLTGNLQKDISLEFSSRALYVLDAVDLAIRTIFAGSTAQKIFDGVSPVPVKVSEIKQVLLDPLWYENRDFAPTELPPWPTPNLEKTIKFLNWHPKQKLVAGLRDTLNYFKDNEIVVPKLEEKEEQKKIEVEDKDWKERKKEELEGLKLSKKEKEPDIPRTKLKKRGVLSILYLLFVVLLVSYSLVWPMVVFGWGVFTFRHQLNQGFFSLQKGEFERGLGDIKQAGFGIQAIKTVFNQLEPIRKSKVFTKEFEIGDSLIKLADTSLAAAQSTIVGTEALLDSIKAVTGEKSESPVGYFSLSQLELASASENLSKASALLSDDNFNKNLPKYLKPEIARLSDKLTLYQGLVNKTRILSILLPNMVAVNGNKNYLILLQNNMELRPTGGFIGSFAKVNFEGGKLKKLEVNDIYNIDGQLSLHIEPPKEIKDDLGQKDWFLRDSNWEPDFPTSARQAEWFYAKETGESVVGTIALDIAAIEKLLSVVGSLDLPDYNVQITSNNLFQEAVTHAETGFFPGSQAKKSFLTALTNQLFSKLFFMPQTNWPAIISSLGQSLDEKHISIYLNDPKLFTYLVSQNWTHALPRQSEQNKNQDFLSVVEANLGANKANYYLSRDYNLETIIGKDGEVKHRLKINYVNGSPSDTFPAGKYKNRLRVYLPFDTKLIRALWGENDISKDVTGFVDYGRSGYSMLLELNPKEQKSLVLDYSVPIKAELKNGKANYRLDIIKQAGTLKDPFKWIITYPISYKILSNQTKQAGPQEHIITTDLSKDRSFEVEFTKQY